MGVESRCDRVAPAADCRGAEATDAVTTVMINTMFACLGSTVQSMSSETDFAWTIREVAVT